MVELVDWFTEQIHALGFAGLEGAYDYLSTMSDAEALEYLKSLLGSEKKYIDFANSYIHRRSQETSREPATATESSSSNANVEWAGTTRAPRKSKRGKGKSKTPGRGKEQNHESGKSFARVVSKAPPRRTEQMKAIQDAPVERMRQQVREYRKTKRPINCIYCGKIECPVQENGACSFCGSPMFSIWKPSETRRGSRQFSQTQMAGNAAVHVRDRSESAVEYGLVLGRHVRRPVLQGNVYVQPEQRDLAGNLYESRFENEERGNSMQSSKDNVSLSKAPVPIDSKEQENHLSNTAEETPKARAVFSDCAYSVQGRLLLDNLESGVCLP